MKNQLWRATLAVAAVVVVSAHDARAQSEADEMDVNREAIDIARPHPEPPAIESVLVFSNRGVHARRVSCIAYDKHGTYVGRVGTDLPAHGVRYILASDFGRPFLGSASCWSRGRMVGSAFLLAPGLTNLPTETASVDHVVRIRFDLLAYRN